MIALFKKFVRPNLKRDGRNDFLTEVEKFATFDRYPFYEIAKKYCKPGYRILDIGAGHGDFASYIDFEDIYLIEGNTKNYELIKQRWQNVYEHVLPKKMPFRDNFFQVIHSSHLIEHFYPEQLYEFLADVDRILDKGGYLIISTPLFWEGFFDDLSHIRPYSPAVIEHYLTKKEHSNVPRTRLTISGQYEVLELQYRYHLRAVPIINISWSNNFLKKLTYRLTQFLRNHNVGVWEKTGYTIVFRKRLRVEKED